MESPKRLVTESNPSAREIENAPEDGLEKSDPTFVAATKGQVITGYEHLGALETIKTFKLCTLVCFAMAFSAATDGYQIGYVKFQRTSFARLSLTVFCSLESMPALLPIPDLSPALPPVSGKMESLHLNRPSSVAGVRSCPVVRSSG